MFSPVQKLFSKPTSLECPSTFYLAILTFIDHVEYVSLTLYHTITTLMTLYKKPLENILGKEKMQATSIFSVSHNVFSLSINRNHHFSNIEFFFCKCFQFGQGQYFVWYRVKRCRKRKKILITYMLVSL